LTTTGRFSCEPHTTPVGFIDAGGRLVVAAANGGSEQHPDWYPNVHANNQVTVEVPGASVSSAAMIAEEPDRSELLQQLVRSLPGMSDHLSAASRDIPVIILTEN